MPPKSAPKEKEEVPDAFPPAPQPEPQWRFTAVAVWADLGYDLAALDAEVLAGGKKQYYSLNREDIVAAIKANADWEESVAAQALLDAGQELSPEVLAGLATKMMNSDTYIDHKRTRGDDKGKKKEEKKDPKKDAKKGKAEAPVEEEAPKKNKGPPPPPPPGDPIEAPERPRDYFLLFNYPATASEASALAAHPGSSFFSICHLQTEGVPFVDEEAADPKKKKKEAPAKGKAADKEERPGSSASQAARPAGQMNFGDVRAQIELLQTQAKMQADTHVPAADLVVFTIPAAHQKEFAEMEQAIGEQVNSVVATRLAFDGLAATTDTLRLPATEVGMEYYTYILDKVPDGSCSPALVLHAMIEQIVMQESPEPPLVAAEAVKDEENQDAVLSLLDGTALKLLGGSPAKQPAVVEEDPLAPLTVPDDITILRHGNMGAWRSCDPNLTDTTKPLVEQVEKWASKLLAGLIPEVEESFPFRPRMSLIAQTQYVPTLIAAMPPDESTGREASIDPALVDRSIVLLEFEKFLNLSSESSKWTFQDRVMVEEFSRETLNQVLSTALLPSPDVCAKYFPAKDAVLVALGAHVPPSRAWDELWEPTTEGTLGFLQWFDRYQANTRLAEEKRLAMEEESALNRADRELLGLDSVDESEVDLDADAEEEEPEEEESSSEEESEEEEEEEEDEDDEEEEYDEDGNPIPTQKKPPKKKKPKMKDREVQVNVPPHTLSYEMDCNRLKIPEKYHRMCLSDNSQIRVVETTVETRTTVHCQDNIFGSRTLRLPLPPSLSRPATADRPGTADRPATADRPGTAASEALSLGSETTPAPATTSAPPSAPGSKQPSRAATPASASADALAVPAGEGLAASPPPSAGAVSVGLPPMPEYVDLRYFVASFVDGSTLHVIPTDPDNEASGMKITHVSASGLVLTFSPDVVLTQIQDVRREPLSASPSEPTAPVEEAIAPEPSADTVASSQQAPPTPQPPAGKEEKKKDKKEKDKPAVAAEESSASVVSAGPGPGEPAQVPMPDPVAVAAGPPEGRVECSRSLLGKGTVLVQYTDNTSTVLFANGNTAQRMADGTVAITNNAGLRCGVTSLGVEFALPAVPVATVTDPDTKQCVTTREDLVVVIDNSDGSRVVQHADGTLMTTSTRQHTVETPEGSEVRSELMVVVQKEGFAKSMCFPELHKTETVLPDGSLIVWADGVAQVWKPDGTLVDIDSAAGTVVYRQRQMPPGTSGEPVNPGGRFVLDLYANTLYALDLEGNEYHVYADGTTSVDLLSARIAREEAAAAEAAAQEAAAAAQAATGPDQGTNKKRVEEEEEEEEEDEEERLLQIAMDEAQARVDARREKRHALARMVEPPLGALRLFVIRRDGSGYELLRTEDCGSWLALVKADPLCTFVKEGVLGDPAATSFLSLLKDRRHLPGQEPLPEPLQPRPVRPPSADPPTVLLMRQIVQYDPCTMENYKWIQASIQSCAEKEVPPEIAEPPPRRMVVSRHTPMTLGQEDAVAARKFKLFTSVDNAAPQSEGDTSSQPSAPAIAEERPPPPSLRAQRVQEREAVQGKYFNSKEGLGFLDTLPPEAKQPITKSKTRREYKPREPSQSTHDSAGSSVGPGPASPLEHFGFHNISQGMEKSADPEFYEDQPDLQWQDVQHQQQQPDMPIGSSLPLYHLRLRAYEYDVLNQPRQHKPRVPNVRKSTAPSVPNEMFHAIESTSRRATHTSSTMLSLLRAQGLKPDGTLLPEFNGVAPPKQLQVDPAMVRFGACQSGLTYRFALRMTNVSNTMCRFRVQQPESASVRVVFSPQPIASGMTIKLEVEMCESQAGHLENTFHIISEDEVFAIPISANVMSKYEFDKYARNTKTGRLPSAKGRIRLMNTQARDARYLKSHAPSIRDVPSAGALHYQPAVMRTAEAAVFREPHIPSTDRDWVVDPNLTLEEVQQLAEAQQQQQRALAATADAVANGGNTESVGDDGLEDGGEGEGHEQDE